MILNCERNSSTCSMIPARTSGCIPPRWLILAQRFGADERYIAVLSDGFTDSDVEVRRAAAQASASAGQYGQRLLPQLIQMLTDSDEMVRVHAAGSVLFITGGHDEALQVLRNSASSTDMEAMSWANFYRSRTSTIDAEGVTSFPTMKKVLRAGYLRIVATYLCAHTTDAEKGDAE